MQSLSGISCAFVQVDLMLKKFIEEIVSGEITKTPGGTRTDAKKLHLLIPSSFFHHTAFEDRLMQYHNLFDR